MISAISVIHYGSVAFIICMNTLAAGIAQGLIAKASVKAMDIQPAAKDEIRRAAFISLVILETCGVLAVLFAILLIFFKNPVNIYSAYSEIGIALALGVTGFMVSLFSLYPARESMYAIARQPFLSKKITNLMLLALSMLQTSFIFGFIVAIIILFQKDYATSIHQACKLIGSGICISLGTIVQ